MSKTARKTGETTLDLGFASGRVTFHKVTTDGGKAAKWETRLVDEEGNPLEEEKPASLPVETLGNPLGDDNEAAAEALDEQQDAALAWGDPPKIATPPPAPVQRQRGFETERFGFVPAEEQLKAIDEYAALDVMRVGGFVRAEQVPRNRIIGSYYLAPADDTSGARARHLMEVLKFALQRTSRMAVVEWTKKKGQSLGVIAPDRSGGLVLLELAWGENVRAIPKTGILNGDIATANEIHACVELIEAMAEPRASMDELRDDAVVLRQQLRALAEDGRVDEFVPPSAETAGSGDQVESLLADLETAKEHAEDFVATA